MLDHAPKLGLTREQQRELAAQLAALRRAEQHAPRDAAPASAAARPAVAKTSPPTRQHKQPTPLEAALSINSSASPPAQQEVQSSSRAQPAPAGPSSRPGHVVGLGARVRGSL